MKNSKLPLYETFSMIIGELITALLVCGAFLILKKFDTSVLFGAILGSAVYPSAEGKHNDAKKDTYH